jgi:peptidoglycan glycosyltransferase
VNAPLRKAGVVLMVLFGLLFLNLNYVQVVKASQYRNDTKNNQTRIKQQEYERERGEIIVDGQPVAQSVPTKDALKFQRTYPGGAMYAHVVGYEPVHLGPTGMELIQGPFLSGLSDAFEYDRIIEALTGKEAASGSVRLTLRKAVQEKAYNALLNNSTASKVGAVVALDPTTGAILAMVSTPSFDPSPLASHDDDAANAAYDQYKKAANSPLQNRATQETFPPGSTFKVIVSAAALQNGLTPDTPLVGGASYTAPDTTLPIKNSPGVVCPDTITLQNALKVSCNTAFARYGTEQLGADKLKKTAQAFGFETAPTLADDPDNDYHVAASATGSISNGNGQTDPAALAQSCIGQREVRMTPLQGALIAASIANNGTMMRPYLVDGLLGPDLKPVQEADPEVLRNPVSDGVAAQLRQMMDSVVSGGTGTGAKIDGYEVGGKTGTAQNGDAPDHGWFIGYARKDGLPVVAVAVLIQNAGSGGSAQATQIAGQVMQAAIEAGKTR